MKVVYPTVPSRGTRLWVDAKTPPIIQPKRVRTVALHCIGYDEDKTGAYLLLQLIKKKGKNESFLIVFYIGSFDVVSFVVAATNLFILDSH